MLTERSRWPLRLTEPDADRTYQHAHHAVKKGDKYVLNGTKSFITNGSHASWYTVYAKTDKEAGHRGISAFVVPRDADGVSVDKKEDKLGQRASDTAMISFSDVEIPADHLLRGKGLQAGDDDPRPHRPGRGGDDTAPSGVRVRGRLRQERVQFGVPIAITRRSFHDRRHGHKVSLTPLTGSANSADRGERTRWRPSTPTLLCGLRDGDRRGAVQSYGGYGFSRSTARKPCASQELRSTRGRRRSAAVIAREVLMRAGRGPAAASP